MIEWVFFDLDGTLWDHKKASDKILSELIEEYGLDRDSFIAAFHRANETLWRSMSQGKTSFQEVRIQRFREALREAGYEKWDEEADLIGRAYLDRYLQAGTAIPGADQAIDAARGIGAKVALLTNAPNETQYVKLERLGFHDAFDFVHTTDDAGACKPDERFYQTALERAGNPDASAILMIGDSWSSDIEPARAHGWNAIYVKGYADGPPAGADPEVQRVNSLRMLPAVLRAFAGY